jgi:hypothetical protein
VISANSRLIPVSTGISPRDRFAEDCVARQKSAFCATPHRLLAEYRKNKQTNSRASRAIAVQTVPAPFLLTFAACKRHPTWFMSAREGAIDE